jgi:ATP phosphoribosyltransferase regulatory subunit
MKEAEGVISSLLPTGFRDRLPPQADESARLVRAILDCAAGFGYERVQTPLAEFETSLTGALGAPSRDLLRFVDPVSGETMAVRSDITGQIGRIASTRMGHHPRPVRLSYGGPVVKLHATQLRPEREMMQVGAELIGLDSVAAATEILIVAIESLRAAGVKSLSLDLTLPDLIDHLAPAGDLKLLKARLDAKDIAAVADEWKPLIAAAGPFDAAIMRLRGFDTGGKLAERLTALEAIVAGLPDGVSVTLDPTERHGFEYQTWFGFSLFSAQTSGEIGRGGSYKIGAEPAIGFSAYIDPLIDAGLSTNERRRLFLPLGTPAGVGHALRAEGWVTVSGLSDGDSAEAQICTHILRDGAPVSLG